MDERVVASGVTPQWTPWRVTAGRTAFEVDDPKGDVRLVQVDKTNFEVGTSFRFVGADVLDDLRRELRDGGHDPAAVERMIDDARTFAAGAERTDLASVPPFMRWFENSYGCHTLAAIIHDRLIVSDHPNDGALGSDTLADRFFRLMMGAAGVPVLKRWIMWAAVALRTRWFAGGWRRWSLVAWIACAVVGNVAAVGAVAGLFGPRLFGLAPGVLALVAVVMPFVSGLLWGRQFGASVVAAVAGGWILPPGVLAALGYLAYRVLEAVTGVVAGDRR